MTITPAKIPLVIYQGGSFDTTLLWQDANGNPMQLAGSTAEMMIRQKVSDIDPLITLTTAANNIILDNVTNIAFNLSPSDTAAFSPLQNGVYDFRLTDTLGKVNYIFGGYINILQMVSR